MLDDDNQYPTSQSNNDNNREVVNLGYRARTTQCFGYASNKQSWYVWNTNTARNSGTIEGTSDENSELGLQTIQLPNDVTYGYDAYLLPQSSYDPTLSVSPIGMVPSMWACPMKPCQNPELFYCRMDDGMCVEPTSAQVGVCESYGYGFDCAANYEPVCGCNGKVYSNACEAHVSGVNVLWSLEQEEWNNATVYNQTKELCMSKPTDPFTIAESAPKPTDPDTTIRPSLKPASPVTTIEPTMEPTDTSAQSNNGEVLQPVVSFLVCVFGAMHIFLKE
jgi:hypothetical protein